MKNPHSIFVHCTATRADWWKSKSSTAKVNEIRRWHVEDRGWRDIGYHYLIDRDGTVKEGRPVTQQGAHARGHNKGTVAISLFGGHGSSENDAFEDNFTPEQDAALRKLIADLQGRFPTIKKVRGHNEVAAKACPGFQVGRWMARKTPHRSAVQSTTNLSAIGGTIATVTTLSDTAKGAVGSITENFGVSSDVALVIIIAACFGWIFRERIRKFAAGDK